MNEEHHRILLQGATVWNTWRKEHPTVSKPDLSRADLSGADLSWVDLSGADLSEVNLSGASLSRTKLQNAILRGSNLTDVKELSEEQLAGTDLLNTTLPENIRAFTGGLARIEGEAKSLQTTQLSLLGACLYAWLTISTTSDAQLLANTASSKLPIVEVSVHIVGFYVFAPVVLLGFYYYFHLYLQRLWEMLSALPAIFPDGKSLDEKSYPRPLSSFVRFSVPLLLKREYPPLSTVPAFVVVLLAWGAVPLTLFAFCWTYLPRHDWEGLVFLTFLLALSILFSVRSYFWASGTLKGQEPPLSNTTIGLTFIVILIVFLSFFSFKLTRPLSPLSNGQDCRFFQYSWNALPQVVEHIRRCPVVANFTDNEVSTKPSSWTDTADLKTEQDITNSVNLVKGAILHNTNLRYLNGAKAFLVRADLRGAQLSDAYLQSAELRGASLARSDLTNANLLWADLRGVDLRGAQLQKATLYGAQLSWVKGSIFTNCDTGCLQPTDLSYADLRRVTLDHADFKGANLQNALLQDSSLIGSWLQGALLQNANLQNADLRKAQLGKTDSIEEKNRCRDDLNICALSSRQTLSGANLTGADLTGADLQEANLDGAVGLPSDLLQKARNAALAFYGNPGHDLFEFPHYHDDQLRKKDLRQHTNVLKKANLHGAHLQEFLLNGLHLQEADLSEADLSEADLSGADLSGAILTNADLHGAKLEKAKLAVQQLCTVKTAYEAKLEPQKMREVKKQCSQILEKPKVETNMQ